ncbi:uncharacterized protein [Porites lutea]|uniref:uncharacterized protein n=1 Tax=Porites lutea TaxID=51062 RepID=UPI003CC6DBC7
MPTNAHSLPVGKKPRPPVPPKPKNYVPKKASLPAGDSMKNDEQGKDQTTKGRADSAPSMPTSSLSADHDSKFFVNLEKESNTIPCESADVKRASQFFVSLDHDQTPSASATKVETESGKQNSSATVTRVEADDKEVTSVVNASSKHEVCQNGVASVHARSTFYHFPVECNSGKESPDPLEGLEIEADFMSDGEGEGVSPDKERRSKLESDSVEVNGAAATDDAGVVLKDRGGSELIPAGTDENVKVVFSLVLEEECSVSMVDDADVQQKRFDVTATEGGKEAESVTEFSNDTENVIYPQKSEEVLEDSLSTEPSHSVTVQSEGYVCDDKVEKPTEDLQACGQDFVSNKEEGTQENIFDGEMPVDETHNDKCKNFEPKYVTQSDNLDLQTEVLANGTPEVSLLHAAEENTDIIIAEPVKEGFFSPVSDHTISRGSVEIAEEGNQFLSTDEGVVKVKEESQWSSSLSESTSNVVQTVSEKPLEEVSEGIENISSDAGQSGVVLTESPPERGESKDVFIEPNIEEAPSDEVVNEQHNEKDSSENTDSFADSDGLVKPESDKKLPICAAETCTANDLSNNSIEGHEDGKKDDVVLLERVDILVADSQEVKDDSKPESPSSPEPIPPARRSRKTPQGKRTYENIEIFSSLHGGNAQTDNEKKDNSLRRTQSFSKYETTVLSLPRPVQRVSDDEAIYRVPSKVVPVQRYTDDDSCLYSVPHTIPTHCIDRDNGYAVPKPIIVQVSAVVDRLKSDEQGAIYAVPGMPTPVPAETFPDQSIAEATMTPQDERNIYVVPGRQNADVTVSAKISGVPPPKPPRLSLCLDQDKTEKILGEGAGIKEVPRPAPRTRAVDDAMQELNKQKGSPSPVPRRSSKTEASGSSTPENKGSPSPVPRQGSKTGSGASTPERKGSPSPLPRSSLQKTETESESQGTNSPVPVRRNRVNALQTNIDASSSSVLPSSSEASVTESTKDDVPKRKVPPPPRPPPPDPVRISIAICQDSPFVPPLTPGLESDSDSDVGEVETPKGPSKPKTHHIAHEILSTERTFVDALKLVFEECYGTIKTANVVAETVLSDIFRDLENIYLLDSRFLQELEERMATWEEHERIGDIIKKYGHFLKMYTQYVNGYDKAMSVFQETMKENPEFAKLVTQFQNSERCHGLILSSYMLKPVQRIPSYRLLLIDYLKHLPKDSEEFKDTETTLKIVSEVATHINESMKKMDSFEQLLKLQSMLIGNPEIVKAGRDYVKEGMLMKLCRKDMQERMFFLLTDVLLYTTPMGANQYKLNKMLPLLGMQVTVPDSPDFVNEFSIISTTRSFTLTASTPEERDEWVEALNNAIDVVTKRKITFVAKTRDAAGLLAEQDGEGTKLGEKAPVWIPDARVTMCMSCTSPFTLTNRRHHCRACGNVVCGSCSESTAPLAYLNYTEARVCDKCYDLLLKEFHTHEIHADEKEETTATLPPLLQETEAADKLLRKPTKFEMMRRFKSRRTKRKSQIIHPTHLTEVAANQEGIEMSGYLRFKKGRHGWKKSWFVLKDNVLYSYKASSDVVALETLPVLGYQIEDLGKEGDDFVFHLKHKGVPPIVFKADNETSAKRWVKGLTKATTM